MNKKILWIIVAVLVVAALFLFIRRDRFFSESMPETKLADDSEMAAPASLRDLVMRNRPMKCSVNEEANQGTFYIADKNMRGDFTSVSDGKSVSGHMIVKDNVSYTWMDGEKTGFKLAANEDLEVEASEGAQQKEQIDLDSKTNYDCDTWSKDNSYFDLPSGVEFTDLSAMMKTSVGAGAEASETVDLKAMQCAACDSVPAESKAQCKSSLGCN